MSLQAPSVETTLTYLSSPMIFCVPSSQLLPAGRGCSRRQTNGGMRSVTVLTTHHQMNFQWTVQFESSWGALRYCNDIKCSHPYMCLQVLVQTGEKNYTAKDALQLLKDLNLTQQVTSVPSFVIDRPGPLCSPLKLLVATGLKLVIVTIEAGHCKRLRLCHVACRQLFIQESTI